MSKTIFLLDDDELILESFTMIFQELGFTVTTCGNSTTGIGLATQNEFDLILSDIRMPGLNGAQAIRAIKSARPAARIYVLTAYPGDPIVHAALEAGALGVMKKPFEIGKILDLLKD